MGTIHFMPGLFETTWEVIKETRDYAEIVNDLNRIDRTIARGTDEEAPALDIALRQKYPAIAHMLAVAEILPKAPAMGSTGASVISPAKVGLRQDRCGILCDAALKAGIKRTMKDCIDCVEA